MGSLEAKNDWVTCSSSHRSGSITWEHLLLSHTPHCLHTTSLQSRTQGFRISTDNTVVGWKAGTAWRLKKERYKHTSAFACSREGSSDPQAQWHPVVGPDGQVEEEMAQCPAYETIQWTSPLSLILTPPFLLSKLQIHGNAPKITLSLLSTQTFSRLLWIFLNFTRAGFYSSLFIFFLVLLSLSAFIFSPNSLINKSNPVLIV